MFTIVIYISSYFYVTSLLNEITFLTVSPYKYLNNGWNVFSKILHQKYINLFVKIGSNFQDEITFDYYLKYSFFRDMEKFPNLSLFSFSSYFLKCPQRTINFVANDEERLEMVELLCKASAKLRSKKTQKLIIVTKWNAQISQGFRNDYIVPYP